MSPSKTIASAIPKQIACLACSTVRVVYGIKPRETGDCPQCGYVGWTYSDDLDGWTRRMIVNGRLAVATPRHRSPRR
jgi:hypothetical protein